MEWIISIHLHVTPRHSNVQKNTVGGNPRDTVLKRSPYPLAFVARGEEELEEEKDEIRKLLRTFSTRWRLFT